MRNKILLDLGLRLPGPLATYMLAGMGYKIVKVEWEDFRDPFSLSMNTRDQTFQSWYQKLQKQKLLKVFSWDNENHMSEWKELLNECSGIILSWPEQLKELSLIDSFLTAHRGPLAYLEVESSRPMHDLNILAQTGPLKAHIFQHKEKSRIPPPFLPVAGICFGQNLALHLLDLLVHAIEDDRTIYKTLSLQESTESFSTIFASPINNPLPLLGPHNGLYPCYYIYRTQSPTHYLALALMEEKYWMPFISELNIPLTVSDRFSQEEKIFQTLEDAIGALTPENALDLSRKIECISLISL